LREIAMVRGSRPLGAPPELTVLDALQFQRLLYEVPDHAFRRSLGELTDILDLGPLLPRQVRALSLGERMRAGLAYALVYRPRVLFLDEPTVGLDVSVAMAMRGFIGAYSRQVGAAVLLTSHHMADVESLCRRVVLVDHGRLVYDGDLMALSARLAPHKLLEVTLSTNAAPEWHRYGETVAGEEGRVVIRVRRELVPAVTARVLADLPVADLSVQEPPLESVIDRIYRSGVAV
jgi:ABC-2 type transport system ATP-binding protein